MAKANPQGVAQRIREKRRAIVAEIGELLELVDSLGEPVEWPTLESPHLGYLTADQVSEAFGVSRKTIARWIEVHGLPHYYVAAGGGSRGRLYFRKGEIQRWMRSRFKNRLHSER